MGIPFYTQVEVENKIPSTEGCFNFEIMNFIAYQADFLKFRVGDLHNTCRLIEGTYFDLLERINENKQQWAIRPLNLVTICEQRNSNSKDKCLDWLDKQKPSPVIFISFGTSTSNADEQIKELALGLGESKVKFIWVLRDPDKGDVFTEEARRAELPKWFEESERNKNGCERLGTSNGNFGTRINRWVHESMRMEFMHGEHYHGRTNSSLAHALRPTNECCATGVNKLMASDEGEMIRKRAGELGETVQQQAAVEGGTPPVELESFIAHITR
ncbi:hypothetical protein CRYUN_Cryun05aG0189600 [Craigia yunnanensis]